MQTTRTTRGKRRREDPSPRVALLALALLLTAALSACATGSGGSDSHRTRGKVSDVAARAAEEDEDARSDGPTRTRTDHEDQSYENDAAQDDDSGPGWFASFFIWFFGGGDDQADAQSGSVGAQYDSRYTSYGDRTAGAPLAPRRNLIVGFTQAYPGGETIDRVNAGSLAYSRFVTRRFRLHLGGFYGEGRKGPHPLVSEGVKTLQEYGLELAGRTYLSREHTALGFYLLFGLRLGELRWTYVRPVSVGDGGEVDSDGVLLLTPFAGLGCAFVRSQSFEAAVNAIWGVRTYGEITNQDFDNDLFDSGHELGWRLEMTVFF